MFNFSKKKQEPKNINEVLTNLNEIGEDVKNIRQELKNLEEKSKNSFQKIGIIRFNSFNDTGGNQSFSLSLLDENNNGLVITSHFGKETNRVYAKPVKGGASDYSLSEEEKNAIKKAVTFV